MDFERTICSAQAVGGLVLTAECSSLGFARIAALVGMLAWLLAVGLEKFEVPLHALL